MLTVDLVRAYRRGERLHIAALKPADRERALALAAQYVAMAKAHVGQRRGELEEAMGAVPVAARDAKLGAGLRKLVLDRCEFEAEAAGDPVELRRAVFARASAVRKGLGPGEHMDRDAMIAEIAAERGMEVSVLERLLYADLRSAHVLLGVSALPADVLIELYEAAQAQAVLLRAVRVVARVYEASHGALRALFHKLKFLRLLHVIEPLEDGGHAITIDGPYSMFRSVTKYGLQLALFLPALRACERWSLEAEVEWGARRQRLNFQLESDGGAAAAEDGERFPDEVAALLAQLRERAAAGKSELVAEPAADILSLPGVGLCVPDLVLVHEPTGACVYVEVLGFWSRQAVWKRVELVERGLGHPIVFAVSSRLRVGEAALGDDLPGALYVYKGAMSARAIEERALALLGLGAR